MPGVYIFSILWAFECPPGHLRLSVAISCSEDFLFFLFIFATSSECKVVIIVIQYVGLMSK